MPDARTRSEALIRALRLVAHPEGGRYRQIYKSASSVDPADGRPRRTALTSIYYLLSRGEFSRWHRVRSDEVWHLYEGETLELLVMPPDFSTVETRYLTPAGAPGDPVSVVPAGWWQAARPLGDYALCGCTVAPGFEFDDFAFLSGEPSARAAFEKRHAGYRDLL